MTPPLAVRWAVALAGLPRIVAGIALDAIDRRVCRLSNDLGGDEDQPTAFLDRYPHGVLLEQEGGVPNDVWNWDAATHICRKHRERERVCRDARRS